MILRRPDPTPNPLPQGERGLRTPPLSPPSFSGKGAGGLGLRRPGLSLLEVLLALTILLMSMSAIGQLVDIGTERGVEARLHSQASRLVQAKMAEVEAGVVPLDTSGTGSFDNEPEWTWTVEPVVQDAPNVYQVTVKVSRDLKGRPFEVSLTQFIFDPNQMGTALPAQKAPDPSASTPTSGTTGGM